MIFADVTDADLSHLTFFAADACSHDLGLWMLLLAVVVDPAASQPVQLNREQHLMLHSRHALHMLSKCPDF